MNNKVVHNLWKFEKLRQYAHWHTASFMILAQSLGISGISSHQKCNIFVTILLKMLDSFL